MSQEEGDKKIDDYKKTRFVEKTMHYNYPKKRTL